jgi:hypothetical protein
VGSADAQVFASFGCGIKSANGRQAVTVKCIRMCILRALMLIGSTYLGCWRRLRSSRLNCSMLWRFMMQLLSLVDRNTSQKDLKIDWMVI